MNAAGGIEIRIASSAEIAELMAENGFDAVPGFIGPRGMKNIQIIADETVRDMKNFVVGINQTVQTHGRGKYFGFRNRKYQIY